MPPDDVVSLSDGSGKKKKLFLRLQQLTAGRNISRITRTFSNPSYHPVNYLEAHWWFLKRKKEKKRNGPKGDS